MPLPEQLTLWSQLAERGERLSVTWNRHGAPKTALGALSALGTVVSDGSARRFIAEKARLLRVGNAFRDLELTRTIDSPMGQHFVYEQRHEGVRVVGGEIKVHADHAGRVMGVSNTYVPEIALRDVRPEIGADDAIEIARKSVPAEAEDWVDVADGPQSELVIHAEGLPALAWRVVLHSNGPTWEVFVDARSGTLLDLPVDINRYINGTGKVFLVNAVVGAQNNTLRDNNDSAAAVPSSSYRIVTLQGLVGNGKLDGTYAASSDNKRRVTSSTHNFQYLRNTQGFNETNVYHWLDYSQRYIQSLGFFNVNNRRQTFSTDRSKLDNAWYTPSTKKLTFGNGGVDDSEDGEVVWHEYGHSIQDNQVPGWGRTHEGGSMGEGFGDYWGASMGAQLSDGFQDACVADWDATSYDNRIPRCLRRTDEPWTYPDDIVGQVHADGEIWSAALWQIRGLLGGVKADQTVLQSHFLLTTTASFNEGANALVTAAGTFCTPAEVDGIRAILVARGFTVTA